MATYDQCVFLLTLSVQTSDLPYQTPVFVKGTLETGQTVLIEGQVIAQMRASSPPRNPDVCMMVVTLEEGFRLQQKVSLSPLVVLGPHENAIDGLEVELSLPITVAPGETATVWVSRTSCDEKSNWQPLPNDTYVVKEGRAVVKTHSFSRYQVRSHLPLNLVISPDVLYFSIFTANCAGIDQTTLLLLRLSKEERHCVTSFREYKLAGIGRDAVSVTINPGDQLESTLKSLTGIHTQMEFNSRRTLDNPVPLDEEIVWKFERHSLFRSVSDFFFGTTRGNETSDHDWLVKRPPGHPEPSSLGELTIASNATRMVECVAGEDEARFMKRLIFKVTWPVVRHNF